MEFWTNETNETQGLWFELEEPGATSTHDFYSKTLSLCDIEDNYHSIKLFCNQLQFQMTLQETLCCMQQIEDQGEFINLLCLSHI